MKNAFSVTVLLVLVSIFCAGMVSAAALNYTTDILPYIIYGSHFTNNSNGVAYSKTNCTATGVPTLTPDKNSVDNQAYIYNGNDGFTWSTAQKIPENRCFSFWYKYNDTNQNKIFGWDAADHVIYNKIFKQANGEMFYALRSSDGNYKIWYSTNSIFNQTDTWYHVAMCQAGGNNPVLYVNNISIVFDAPTSVGTISLPTAATIPFNFPNPELALEGLEGVMDEVLVLNTSLTIADFANYMYARYDTWEETITTTTTTTITTTTTTTTAGVTTTTTTTTSTTTTTVVGDVDYETEIKPYLIVGAHFSGNANSVTGAIRNGTVVGNTALTTDIYGNSSKAYDFDGNGDYIKWGATGTGLEKKTCFSWWVMYDDLNDYGDGGATDHRYFGYAAADGVIYREMRLYRADSYDQPTRPWEYLYQVRAPDVSHYKLYGTESLNASEPYLETNDWYHIFACMNDTENPKIYVNGVYYNTSYLIAHTPGGAITLPYNTDVLLTTGAMSEYLDMGLHGKLDEVVVINNTFTNVSRMANYFYTHYDTWETGVAAPTTTTSTVTTTSTTTGSTTTTTLGDCEIIYIESDNSDGVIYFKSYTSFNFTRSYPLGMVLDYSADTMKIQSRYDGSQYYIYRDFMSFELPEYITSLDAITNASLILAVPEDGAINEVNDGYDYVALVMPTLRASWDSLALSDYNKCGSSEYPHVIAPTLDITSIKSCTDTAVCAWSISLNMTEFRDYAQLLSPFGIGIREGHDIENIDIGLGDEVTGRNLVSFYTADAGEPSWRPRLRLEYCGGGVPATTTTTTAGASTTTTPGATTTTTLTAGNCSDSDSGYNTTTGGYISSGTYYYEDVCVNSTHLTEYMCYNTGDGYLPWADTYNCGWDGQHCITDLFTGLGYCDSSCLDIVSENGIMCWSGVLYKCNANGAWGYMVGGYSELYTCAGKGYVPDTCLNDDIKVYSNDTVNYANDTCEPLDTSVNCTDEHVTGSWRCTGTEGYLYKCLASGAWVLDNSASCWMHEPPYTGGCAAEYTNETISGNARAELCAIDGCFEGSYKCIEESGHNEVYRCDDGEWIGFVSCLDYANCSSTPSYNYGDVCAINDVIVTTTTTLLPMTDNDNAITRGLDAIGETFRISKMVLWFLLMLIAGGFILYYMRDSGFAFVTLIAAEAFLVIVGTILGIIGIGIIIIIAIIGAAMAAFWFHKLLSGNSGG